MTPRSYTFFMSQDELTIDGASALEKIATASKIMGNIFGKSRTCRLTLPSISINAAEDFEVDISVATHWYKRALEKGVRWVNQPFRISNMAGVENHALEVVTSILHKHEKMFSSIIVDAEKKIGIGSEIYSIISKSLSRRDHKGFNNFRFGIGFNIAESTPFFPFSNGSKTGVSVALESLPLVREVWNQTHDFEAIKASLHKEIVQSSEILEYAAEKAGIAFLGIDWSLAPLPNCDETVVGLVEQISGNPIGSGATLSTIANLTTCLKAPILKDPLIMATGFNGVMLSVLEDDILANRFLHKTVTVNDLLLYSSVCGCGLDMLPISGDTPEVSIAEYSCDTGHMAYRLNKPLGVRFLPIGRLKEGQRTNFSHDFVNNSAVVKL